MFVGRHPPGRAPALPPLIKSSRIVLGITIGCRSAYDGCSGSTCSSGSAAAFAATSAPCGGGAMALGGGAAFQTRIVWFQEHETYSFFAGTWMIDRMESAWPVCVTTTWGPRGQGVRGVKTMVKTVGGRLIALLESYGRRWEDAQGG